jgi:hypothetical protein
MIYVAQTEQTTSWRLFNRVSLILLPLEKLCCNLFAQFFATCCSSNHFVEQQHRKVLLIRTILVDNRMKKFKRTRHLSCIESNYPITGYGLYKMLNQIQRFCSQSLVLYRQRQCPKILYWKGSIVKSSQNFWVFWWKIILTFIIQHKMKTDELFFNTNVCIMCGLNMATAQSNPTR